MIRKERGSLPPQRRLQHGESEITQQVSVPTLLLRRLLCYFHKPGCFSANVLDGYDLERGKREAGGTQRDGSTMILLRKHVWFLKTLLLNPVFI